ncbi:MAG TPA: hypothetical protein PKA63_08890 [Oligoflexia bacterium]|nr:hypothetical protein [Oligoflexia bacterium]HMP48767.1 hypothetical protein [Oligoflexia bacterium]
MIMVISAGFKRVEVRIFVLVLFIFLFSGCQISLFPKMLQAKKYILGVFSYEPSAVTNSTCSGIQKRVYISEIEVVDYLRSIRVRFERVNSSGSKVIKISNPEVVTLSDVEWASSFDSLFLHAIENGLRSSFASAPGIVFLSSQSSAFSEYELGVKLNRLWVEDRFDNSGDNGQSVMSGEIVMRLFSVITGAENYFTLQTSLPITNSFGKSVPFEELLKDELLIISSLQGVANQVFKEMSEILGGRLCAENPE